MAAASRAGMISEMPPASSSTPYPVAARRLLRDTLLDAARGELQGRPWSDISMADVASTAGVSRQTLYKEFGSRDEFAQAFVIREGERFLDMVEESMNEHLDDPQEAVHAALSTFLSTAAEDPLVRMVISDDGSGGMLPLVTTQGGAIVHWASARLSRAIRAGWPTFSAPDADRLAESLVRLAISYVTLPEDSPERTARSMADLFAPYIERALAATD